jgi:flagella synthesis protein FlgN
MTPVKREIMQLLEAETGTATELLACLKDEQAALQQLEADKLETTVACKLELLEQMNRHAAERDRLLERACVGNETRHIQTYIAEQAPDALTLWHQLLQLAVELEQQNQVNGNMIQVSQQRTQMAIDLITRPQGDPKTYGKQGYTENDASPLTSVKA